MSSFSHETWPSHLDLYLLVVQGSRVELYFSHSLLSDILCLNRPVYCIGNLSKLEAKHNKWKKSYDSGRIIINFKKDNRLKIKNKRFKCMLLKQCFIHLGIEIILNCEEGDSKLTCLTFACSTMLGKRNFRSSSLFEIQ